jgi:DNA polymerase III subunit delta
VVSAVPRLAYLWGEDAYGIERAVAAFAARLADELGAMDVWRSDPDDGAEDATTSGASGSAARRRARQLEEIELRLATMPLFGGGTLVVVRQPGSLVAEAGARERLSSLVAAVPEGNALCFSDLVGSDGKLPATRAVLRDAVAAAGGLVQELNVPTRERMDAWLTARAGELGIRLAPGAARLLAERVGAHVRESDVDRRRQTELAANELEKLALYRPGGTVEAHDVAELVTESVPGSTWAFLDAVGGRRGGEAARLLERLLAGGAPVPVVVSQVHRRLRELVSIRDLVDGGARPPDVARTLRLQPFRAQKLGEQAARWSASELQAALEAILDVDLRSKGISLDGRTVQMSDRLDALALTAWLADHATPLAGAGGTRAGSAGGTRPGGTRADGTHPRAPHTGADHTRT